MASVGREGTGEAGLLLFCNYTPVILSQDRWSKSLREPLLNASGHCGQFSYGMAAKNILVVPCHIYDICDTNMTIINLRAV